MVVVVVEVVLVLLSVVSLYVEGASKCERTLWPSQHLPMVGRLLMGMFTVGSIRDSTTPHRPIFKARLLCGRKQLRRWLLNRHPVECIPKSLSFDCGILLAVE